MGIIFSRVYVSFHLFIEQNRPELLISFRMIEIIFYNLCYFVSIIGSITGKIAIENKFLRSCPNV